MANACPNINSESWQNLVAEFDNSRIRAMEAYQENGNEIPAIDSELVQRLKKNTLKTGEEVKIVLDDDGRETDKYKSVAGKLYQRVNSFISNFAAKPKDKNKTFAERAADNFWGPIDHDEKLVTKSGEAQTRDEFRDFLQRNTDFAIAKGLIVHLAIKKKLTPHKAAELDAEIQAIELEAATQNNGDLPFSWKWIEDVGSENTLGTIEQIFKNLDLNYFDELEAEDEILRDEIFSELTVSSKLFGIAGTIDMLVHHADRTYSIVDWKTGSTLNKSFYGLDNLIMKYGSQGTREIEDSVRNRAKLQIALYAVLLRSENPNIQFRNLSLAWIPNKYNALEKNRDSSVDVLAYIPMIEQFLKDPAAAENAGLPRNIHAKLLEANPNIFNPTAYSSNVSSDMVNRVILGDTTPQQEYEDSLQRLKYILGGATNFDELPESQQIEAMELVDDINKFMGSTAATTDKTQYEDMSFFNLWLGNYSDVNHPMVQSLKAFQDEMQYKAKKVIDRKINKFNSLLLPVLKAYYKEKGIKNIAGNRAINADDLYAPFFVDQKISDEVNQTRERLLTKNEEDPELLARYRALSSDQKKLIDYINETFSEYFNGEKAYLNDTAVITKDGTRHTHLALYNSRKSIGDKRGWYDGFFFKVEPTDADIIIRNGGNNYMKGMFSKKTRGSIMYKYATLFREREFERWDDETQAVPLRYLGTESIDANRYYTRNLETIFNRAVSHLETRKEEDAVYALGQAIKIKLSLEKDHNGEPAYENIIKFLDHKLLMDIQGKMRTIGSRGRLIRIPMYTPSGWQQEKVSIDAVLRGLTKWASMNTMWIRPFQGVGNGVHAMLLTHRDGMKGSLSKVNLFGIDGNAVDFGIGDITHAEAEYFRDYIGKAIQGKFRESKMYLLAKEFNYFGNNYDYAEMQKTLLSLRNRYMNESMMYMFHALPEEFVSMTTMAAQLMHMKNRATGESIWNSYKVVDGKDEEGNSTGIKELEWVGGVRGVVQKGSGATSFTETLTGLNSMEQAKIRKVHERLQGGYRKDEASILEAYAVGKMVIHLKKYLPRLILNTFHGKRTETHLGYYKQMIDSKTGEPKYVDEDGNKIPVYEWQARITEGRMRTLGGVFLSLVSLGTTMRQYRFSELEDEQKQNLIEAVLTMTIFLAAYGAYLTWFEDLDDDDTTKKWWKMYLVDNLSQQYNLVDLAKTMKHAVSPVAFAKVSDFAVHGSVALFATANYAFGNNDAAFTKKGDLRGWNSFIKTIPLVSSYKDVINRFENIKDDDAIINVGLETIRLK